MVDVICQPKCEEGLREKTIYVLRKPTGVGMHRTRKQTGNSEFDVSWFGHSDHLVAIAVINNKDWK